MIETKNIYRTYGHGETKVAALKSINLKVDDGGFVAIMGPSGSGKSTLLNILGCLDRPTKGKYFLSGVDTGKLNADEKAILRRNTIGFVFQSFNLLPRLSAYSNVELPLIYGGVEKKQRHERVMQMLEIMKMADRSKHLPGELSGGQKQRTAIARALVLDPKLILADEPTGNLDQKTGESIMDLFKKLNKNGKTIILITHDASIAKCASSVAQIKDGIFMEEAV